jgi:DedD protein
MAFFKFRKGGDEQSTPASAPESVEGMRIRARHRLIGASVLVLLGVIGFPLLFDSQPRPISVDIPIEIPDKNTIKPLASARPSTPASQVIVETEAGTKSVEPASVPATPPVKANVKPESKPTEKPAEKPVDKPAEKVADKVPERTVPRDSDGAKAQALLEGKTVEQSASAPSVARFVVQIGAYADAVKAQEARAKLEKAGLKTYTQVVQPKEGKRIRVRVGPFESRAEADKVAEKIKKLDLPASILEL